MGSHSVTCHPKKWTRPAKTPASQAGIRFTYSGGMEGWVDLGSLIAARPGIEPTTAWSQVRRPNCYATKTGVRNARCFRLPRLCFVQKRSKNYISVFNKFYLRWSLNRTSSTHPVQTGLVEVSVSDGRRSVDVKSSRRQLTLPVHLANVPAITLYCAT